LVSPFVLFRLWKKEELDFSPELFAGLTCPVIPAKAGIASKTPNSGSPPAFAGVARNDDFSFLPKVFQEPILYNQIQRDSKGL